MSDMTSRMQVTILQIPSKHWLHFSLFQLFQGHFFVCDLWENFSSKFLQLNFEFHWRAFQNSLFARSHLKNFMLILCVKLTSKPACMHAPVHWCVYDDTTSIYWYYEWVISEYTKEVKKGRKKNLFLWCRSSLRCA